MTAFRSWPACRVIAPVALVAGFATAAAGFTVTELDIGGPSELLSYVNGRSPFTGVVRYEGRACTRFLLDAGPISEEAADAPTDALRSGHCPVAALQRGPAETGPGTTAAARRYLEGRWSLISFDLFRPGEPSIRVPGSGMLRYDNFGNLDVEIRVDEDTAVRLEDAGIRTVRGVLSTSGRTVVDMQRRVLTYVLDGQPSVGARSGPLALNRPRHWQVEGNILTLTTKDDHGVPLSVARWEKVP